MWDLGYRMLTRTILCNIIIILVVYTMDCSDNCSVLWTILILWTGLCVLYISHETRQLPLIYCVSLWRLIINHILLFTKEIECRMWSKTGKWACRESNAALPSRKSAIIEIRDCRLQTHKLQEKIWLFRLLLPIIPFGLIRVSLFIILPVISYLSVSNGLII